MLQNRCVGLSLVLVGVVGIVLGAGTLAMAGACCTGVHDIGGVCGSVSSCSTSTDPNNCTGFGTNNNAKKACTVGKSEVMCSTGGACAQSCPCTFVNGNCQMSSGPACSGWSNGNAKCG